MEKRPLLQASPQQEYHACSHSHSRPDVDSSHERDLDDSRTNVARSFLSSHGQLDVTSHTQEVCGDEGSPTRDTSQRRLENVVKAQVLNKPVSSSKGVTRHSRRHKGWDDDDDDDDNNDDNDRDAGKKEKSCAEEEEGVENKVPADQTRRIVLLTLIGFLASSASRLHSPVITLYTYQVYTEQVYGNLSAHVQISSKPCLNDSAPSSANASDLYTDPDTRVAQVQDLSGDFLSRTTLMDGAVALVVNLFLGSYSDVIGRRMVLLLPLFGHFLRNAAAPVVIYWDLGLPGLYVGYVLDGLFGGFPAIVLGLYAYTADITHKGGQRTISMAIVETSIGLGTCALQVVAGLFIQDVGFFYPALVATALELVCVVLVCALPETVSRDRKKKMISPWKSLKRMVGTFLPRDSGYRRALLLLGLAVFFIVTLAPVASDTIESLFLMDHPFCWSAFRQGILGAAQGVSGYLGANVLFCVLKGAVSQPFMVILGLISDIAKNVVFAFAKTDLTIYMVVIAGLARRMIYPALRSFLSSLVPRDRQGAMFAGVAVVESGCQCIGQEMFVNVYTATLAFMPGFVFLMVGAADGVVIIMLTICIFLYRKMLASRLTIMTIQAPEGGEEDHGIKSAPGKV